MSVGPPAALLFPGAGLSARPYRRLTRRVPGLSVLERTPGGSLTTDAAHLAQAAPAAGRPVVAVGHSMGGFAAEAAVRRHPQAAAALVLVDASVPREQVEPPPPGQRRTATSQGVALLNRWGGPRAPWARIAADLTRYPSDEAQILAIRRDAPLPDVPVIVLSAAWTALTPWHRRWLQVQDELADRLAQDHPGGSAGVCRRVLVPCGHGVMWWRPDAIAEAVEQEMVE
ncbi:MAG: alpha/beta hydrolase [Austwickia sp.]|nr:alpha/beta hydrolase [Austwickia sp.]